MISSLLPTTIQSWISHVICIEILFQLKISALPVLCFCCPHQYGPLSLDLVHTVAMSAFLCNKDTKASKAISCLSLYLHWQRVCFHTWKVSIIGSPNVGNIGFLELCLHGIRELATAIHICIWSRLEMEGASLVQETNFTYQTTPGHTRQLLG